MSREKQIEEMAQFMAVISHLECGRNLARNVSGAVAREVKKQIARIT